MFNAEAGPRGSTPCASGITIPHRWAAAGHVSRLTENIVDQIAHTFDVTTPGVQVTRYVYGTVAGSASNADDSLIGTNDLLAEIQFPCPDTGEACDAADGKVRYAYNRLGEVRSTIDQNGTSHDYGRDLNGRVTADVAAVDTNGPLDDRVDRITVAYDDVGRPTLIQSHSDTTMWNSVAYVYTALGQIATIKQENFGSIDGSTPEVRPSTFARWCEQQLRGER